MARSSAGTRKALLVAAREEFAEHGVAGARVDRIADQAGVNKERLYKHFGSKDGLFDAVMAEVLDEFDETVALPARDVGDYVINLYDYHREHPQMLRLLLWEGLRGRGRPDRRHAEHYRKRMESLARLLGCEPGPEVARALLTLCGVASWPHAVPQVAELLLGEDDGALRGFLATFARAHVEGSPGGQGVDQTSPVKGLTDSSPSRVDEAAEQLRAALAAADLARAELVDALRAEHDSGASANQLAQRVHGLMSRPLVLRALAGGRSGVAD
ncbi:TetR/AcrR family transcriptional regulator [Saccharopolyspora indica]|uniref:TetR/AcrR family transcriptional regulator n=1 Tax=Saccharopolyspora indica TaxID=1229659 RepID=UPI0022EB8274|nr:TetR/AcrR family transcriptional regulator [Saccharopolyspora indica]MDA3649572.1 TetR/AcrR family transcriptional regulator [Saccharopolyspora indica]